MSSHVVLQGSPDSQLHCLLCGSFFKPILIVCIVGYVLYQYCARTLMEGSQLPTEVLLLEYDRVSELLNDPAFWSMPGVLASILLIATNGSILAHAYANPPSVRIMRSDATSYSATYTAYMNTAHTSHENGVTRCVDGQATVITSVAPHVLLAVTGKRSDSATSDKITSSSSSSTSSSHPQHTADEPSEFPQHDLDTLLSISHDLTSLLRADLSDMRWPEDY